METLILVLVFLPLFMVVAFGITTVTKAFLEKKKENIPDGTSEVVTICEILPNGYLVKNENSFAEGAFIDSAPSGAFMVGWNVMVEKRNGKWELWE